MSFPVNRSQKYPRNLSIRVKILFFQSGGWQKFQEAMTESFGENWENEFRSLTGEDPPGKHFYRDIYEEELEKPAGIWFKMVLSG